MIDFDGYVCLRIPIFAADMEDGKEEVLKGLARVMRRSVKTDTYRDIIQWMETHAEIWLEKDGEAGREVVKRYENGNQAETV